MFGVQIRSITALESRPCRSSTSESIEPAQSALIVGAAEVVVTKPGYGIIAECIANESAILDTSRGHFPEYDVLVDDLPRYARSAFINHDDLFAGKWESHLDKLLAQPKQKNYKKPDTNGADVAAEILLKALDKPPKKPRGRPKAKF